MNSTFKKVLIISAALLIGVFAFLNANAQQSNKKPFKVIAFYTERNDAAHISFVHEANKWFPEMGKER